MSLYKTILVPVEYSAWVTGGKALEIRNGCGKPARLGLQLEYGNAGESKKTVLTNPTVRVGDQEIVFKTAMSPGDRLVCRSATDCRLYRPGRAHEEVRFDGVLPSVKDSLTILVLQDFHALQVRALLSWPGLAVNIPRR